DLCPRPPGPVATPSFASPPPSIDHKGSSDRGTMPRSTVEHGPRQLRRLSAESLQQDRMELSSLPYLRRASLLIMLQHQLHSLSSSEFDSTPTALHSESERFWSSSDGAVGGANAAPSPSPGCHCGPYFTLIIASRILSKRVGSSLTLAAYGSTRTLTDDQPCIAQYRSFSLAKTWALSMSSAIAFV